VKKFRHDVNPSQQHQAACSPPSKLPTGNFQAGSYRGNQRIAHWFPLRPGPGCNCGNERYVQPRTAHPGVVSTAERAIAIPEVSTHVIRLQMAKLHGRRPDRMSEYAPTDLLKEVWSNAKPRLIPRFRHRQKISCARFNTTYWKNYSEPAGNYYEGPLVVVSNFKFTSSPPRSPAQ